MKKILTLILVMQGILISAVCAQEKINGKIVDRRDQTILAGATVTVKNQTRQTTSDPNGNFSLDLPNGSYLLNISYLGYRSLDTLITVPTKPIVLGLDRAANQLDEVVVSTGYQKLPRERSTGSFTIVDQKTLDQQIGTNIINRLDGITSSISIDNKTNGGTMMVRGLSTIRGPREPLIILDNFPYEGSLDNINPNDIESVTLLKDAAAASIWGARAGNGVIVLTSKKAQYGQVLKITANASMNVIQTPDLYAKKEMSPAEYIEIEQFLFSKGAYTSSENSTAHPALTPVVEILIAARDGKITAAQRDEQLNRLRGQDLRSQLNKYVYQNAVNQQYYVDLKGGDVKSAYNIGIGYDHNVSELAATYNRLNLKVDHQIKITDKLSINARANYTNGFSASGKSDLSGDRLPLYTAIADDQGNPISVMKDYRSAYTSTLGNGQLLSWDYYPLNDYRYNNNTTKLQELLINALLSYKIIKGLQFDLRYQYQRQSSTGKLVQGLESYYTRRTINFYTQFDAGVMKRNVPLGEILTNRENLLTINNARAQLNYNYDLKRHQLTVLTGAEVKNAYSYSGNSTVYGYNDELLTYQNVDLVNTYTTIISGAKVLIPNTQGYSSNLNRFISLFANAAYTLDHKYTLTLSGRKDASNLFGVKSNDRWNILWSSGASWLISGEDFYKVKFLPYLKLRASYGASGNIDPSMSAITTLTYASASPYTQLPVVNFSTYANPELRWEKVKTLNLGLDFTSTIGGLSGSVEYYRKKATDLFGQELLDYTTGIGATIVKNTASMQAWGMDIELKASLNFGKVKWSPNAFINYYKDKVTDYYLSSTQASAFVNGDLTVSAVVGKPVYSMLSYKWAGLDAVGDPQGYFNGAVSKNYASLLGSATKVTDLVYSGPLYAPISGGFGNTFQYQKIALSVQLN
ncbi:MAG: SusC/RagA family TonB-linked outer membrane protein, partial [Pedobacter sp.]|nr:SusC/RagA family TonB-linked outer membrane protein [Pedobacter sp.]